MTSGAWSRRDFFRRSAAVGAFAVAGPTLISACTSVSSGNTLEEARKAGKIKIGIANEAPYGFTDSSGKVTGEAPEVARAVFKALGINEVEAVPSNFDGLIPGLNAKNFDMVAAGMYIIPARCKNAAFSTPDYVVQSAFLVPKGNPQQIQSFDDVAAKKVNIAVLSGAVEKGYATSAGVPEDQITTLDTQDNMLRAVADGRVYAAALSDISLNYLAERNPTVDVEVTEGFIPKADGKDVVSAGGFVFRTDDTATRDAFNVELKKLHDSGEWLRIAEPFGFSADNVPGPDVTTEKLCAG
jgi:polar amino acid transport system substrate-binding protein